VKNAWGKAVAGVGGLAMSQTKPKPSPRSNDPRTCVVRALQWVFAKHQPVDHFFDRDVDFLALSSRDQALTRAIVGTALRHLGQIDAIVADLLKRSLPKKAVAARQILRAGLAELLFMRTKPHAVVHSLVQLSGRWREARHYKGLINALFRRVTKDGPELLAEKPLELNVPNWPGEGWDQTYGSGTRVFAAEAMQAPPPLDLTLLDAPQTIIEELDGTLIGQTLRLSQRGRVEDLPGFEDGCWIVQDAAVALPVQILAPQPNEKIGDLCAAPGGKTMQLAHAGAEVTAVDASEIRMQRVAQNLTRTGLTAKTVIADASQWQPDQKFDAILLDAPCSATGVFRHHPDVLYNRRAQDLEALCVQQLALAQNAAQMLTPGGRMMYCVCSAEPQEAEEMVSHIMQTCDLQRVPITQAEAGFAANWVKNGFVRIPPGALLKEGGIDAFFIARFSKPMV